MKPNHTNKTPFTVPPCYQNAYNEVNSKNVLEKIPNVMNTEAAAMDFINRYQYRLKDSFLSLSITFAAHHDNYQLVRMLIENNLGKDTLYALRYVKDFISLHKGESELIPNINRVLFGFDSDVNSLEPQDLLSIICTKNPSAIKVLFKYFDITDNDILEFTKTVRNDEKDFDEVIKIYEILLSSTGCLTQGLLKNLYMELIHYSVEKNEETNKNLHEVLATHLRGIKLDEQNIKDVFNLSPDIFILLSLSLRTVLWYPDSKENSLLNDETHCDIDSKEGKQKLIINCMFARPVKSIKTTNFESNVSFLCQVLRITELMKKSNYNLTNSIFTLFDEYAANTPKLEQKNILSLDQMFCLLIHAGLMKRTDFKNFVFPWASYDVVCKAIKSLIMPLNARSKSATDKANVFILNLLKTITLDKAEFDNIAEIYIKYNMWNFTDTTYQIFSFIMEAKQNEKERNEFYNKTFEMALHLPHQLEGLLGVHNFELNDMAIATLVERILNPTARIDTRPNGAQAQIPPLSLAHLRTIMESNSIQMTNKNSNYALLRKLLEISNPIQKLIILNASIIHGKAIKPLLDSKLDEIKKALSDKEVLCDNSSVSLLGRVNILRTETDKFLEHFIKDELPQLIEQTPSTLMLSKQGENITGKRCQNNSQSKDDRSFDEPEVKKARHN